MPSTPPRGAEHEPARILVAEDEESMRLFLERGLTRLGYEVVGVPDGEQALVASAKRPFDVAVVDLRMPCKDGLAVLGHLKSVDPDALVILMTAFGSIATAVEAMKIGAFDFLTKPFELDELEVRLGRALALRRAQRENRALRKLSVEDAKQHGLAGDSAAIRVVRKNLEVLRNSSATVLVTGESGTGKSLVARALHQLSDRANAPFVVVPCAALPETLFESELFGHESGAFTGAVKSRAGLVARAQGGTLFFDEIGELSLASQAKLERFLQDRVIVPLGGTTPVPVDVRVVAATNRDLAEATKTGAFRSELLWRLDVVRIHVPPLRERAEDIALLVAHSLKRLGEREGKPIKTLTRDALAALAGQDWPGNVRELQNVVERMAIMSGEQRDLGIDDLPEDLRGEAALPSGDREYQAAVARFDRSYFTSLLARWRGNVTEAAKAAGLSRGHLHRRIRELGIEPSSFR